MMFQYKYGLFFLVISLALSSTTFAMNGEKSGVAKSKSRIEIMKEELARKAAESAATDKKRVENIRQRSGKISKLGQNLNIPIGMPGMAPQKPDLSKAAKKSEEPTSEQEQGFEGQFKEGSGKGSIRMAKEKPVRKGIRRPSRWERGGSKVALPLDDVVNAYLTDGDTTLIKAVISQDFPEVTRLLKSGADPRINQQGTSINAYDFAKKATNFLLKQAVLNAQDSVTGDTELIRKVREGDEESVRQLLAHGANPDIANLDGDDAIAVAIALNTTYPAMLPLLINFQDPYTYGLTPLMRAVRTGDAARVEMLLKHGADVKIKRFTGQDAQFYASGIKDTALRAQIEELLGND